MNSEQFDERLTLGDWISMRWFAFRYWMRRCPDCGVRGYYPGSPRWEDDRVAQMFGIADEGCPNCGKREVSG